MNSIISAGTAVTSAVVLILFALPSYIGALRQRGLGRGLLVILFLGLFCLIFESTAIKTGFPYGGFTYGDMLGYKILGLTPWTVFFAYPPIIMGAFWLASKITTSAGRIFFTALFALATDVVLDPALTRMSVWVWDNPGSFYGVPLLNFAGWFVSGIIAAWIMHAIWGTEETVRRSLAYSGFAITWFWAGVNIGLQQWIPAGLGVGIGLVILLIMRAEKRRERS